jgi:hypothetical protein
MQLEYLGEHDEVLEMKSAPSTSLDEQIHMKNCNDHSHAQRHVAPRAGQDKRMSMLCDVLWNLRVSIDRSMDTNHGRWMIGQHEKVNQ